MASQFGILTITDLSNLVGWDLQQVGADSSGIGKYNDAYLESVISLAESMVFSYIRREYTPSTIPNTVRFAIQMLAKRIMENRLINDKFMEGDAVDEMAYLTTYIAPLLSDFLKSSSIQGITKL